MKRICVYCGSSSGKRPDYLAGADELGAVLADNQIGLVYGGAGIGLMGQIANSVLRHGGEVIGIIPRSLLEKEIAHEGLTELKVVGSMHERKALMAELSDGFIAMPGGLGTLEELFETLTWAQLRFHRKPCAAFNLCGYYDGLLTLLDHAADEQFVKPQHRQLLIVDDNPSRLLQTMMEYQAPP